MAEANLAALQLQGLQGCILRSWRLLRGDHGCEALVCRADAHCDALAILRFAEDGLDPMPALVELDGGLRKLSLTCHHHKAALAAGSG